MAIIMHFGIKIEIIRHLCCLILALNSSCEQNFVKKRAPFPDWAFSHFKSPKIYCYSILNSLIARIRGSKIVIIVWLSIIAVVKRKKVFMTPLSV